MSILVGSFSELERSAQGCGEGYLKPQLARSNFLWRLEEMAVAFAEVYLQVRCLWLLHRSMHLGIGLLAAVPFGARRVGCSW